MLDAELDGTRSALSTTLEAKTQVEEAHDTARLALKVRPHRSQVQLNTCKLKGKFTQILFSRLMLGILIAKVTNGAGPVAFTSRIFWIGIMKAIA